MVLANNHVYEGEFRDDRMHGKGTCSYDNGSYTGEYFEGKMNGLFLFYLKDKLQKEEKFVMEKN